MACKGKYKPELAQTIVDLVAEKNLNDRQCAEALSIVTSTFYAWLDHNHDNYKKEFSEAYKNAKEVKRKNNIAFLETQTNKHIEGYYAEDIITDIQVVNGTEKKHVKKVKRWVAGSAAVLIHEKKTADPERWNETYNIQGEINLTGVLDLLKNGELKIEDADLSRIDDDN